jgi:hypothetical protein
MCSGVKTEKYIDKRKLELRSDWKISLLTLLIAIFSSCFGLFFLSQHCRTTSNDIHPRDMFDCIKYVLCIAAGEEIWLARFFKIFLSWTREIFECESELGNMLLLKVLGRAFRQHWEKLYREYLIYGNEDVTRNTNFWYGRIFYAIFLQLFLWLKFLRWMNLMQKVSKKISK